MKNRTLTEQEWVRHCCSDGTEWAMEKKTDWPTPHFFGTPANVYLSVF